jgi:hypothetical protein
VSANVYLRAARRKHGDPAVIFETAALRLEPRQLAQVVDALRERHPNWKLRKRDRDHLVEDLLLEGRSQTWIASKLGCAPRTVARRAEALSVGPTDRLNKGCQPDISGGRVSLAAGSLGGLRTPLSFSAAGTPWPDHKAILEALEGTT